MILLHVVTLLFPINIDFESYLFSANIYINSSVKIISVPEKTFCNCFDVNQHQEQAL